GGTAVGGGRAAPVTAGPVKPAAAPGAGGCVPEKGGRMAREVPHVPGRTVRTPPSPHRRIAMRMTGIALMIASGGILIFCSFAAMTADNQPAANAQVQVLSDRPLAIPVTIALGAGLAGLLMYVFGDRGYVVKRPPDQP